MADANPPSKQRPAGTQSKPVSRRQIPQRRLSRGHAGPGHSRQMSRRDLVQKQLADGGSYHKYYKSIFESPFSVKIRCACGRSRKPPWMFICTYCATGTIVKKNGSTSDSNNNNNNDNNGGINADNNTGVKRGQQRPFLCCDMCATKQTESYYCPHCLAAFPAHYVKKNTRCTRCVACPVCESPLEKIVYSGASKKIKDDTKDNSNNNNNDNNTDNNSAVKKPEDVKKAKKDVYLYQCPFCYWSSNTVGLEAAQSDKLLENLNTRLKLPKTKMNDKMKDIKSIYDKLNERLRKSEDEVHTQKKFQYGSKGKFGLNNDKSKNKSGNALGVPKQKSKRRGHHQKQPSIMFDKQARSEIEKLNAKLMKKFKNNHVISREPVISEEPALDMRFVNQFHLKHYAPLHHQLNDPLFQAKDLDKYLPKRYHLMTKESYKCPQPSCQKYVCKPTLRGRQANFDKRTAVLDYLPRVEIKLISGNLLATTTSKILVIFTNRHLQNGKFILDSSVNDGDKFSTADVKCNNNEYFEIDAANIHIKGGAKPLNKRDNNDYTIGKESGVHFDITPKFYSENDIKFSVKITFETVLEIKDDKSGSSASHKPSGTNSDDANRKRDLTKQRGLKHEQIQVTLPYIIDFNLGPAKLPGGLSNNNNNNSVKGLLKDRVGTTNNNNNNNSAVDSLLNMSPANASASASSTQNPAN